MALTTIKVAAMAVNSVDSDQYVDGSIDNVHLADDAVDSDEIAAGAVDTAHIGDDQVTADKLANSINTEIAANTAKVTNATHTGDVTGGTALTIAAGAVETGMIAADAVDGTKIGDDSIDSEHYVDGSIDSAHLSTSARNIPASTNSTLVAADAGKHISITAGITINASTDFAIGDAVTIFNNQAAGNDETITATGIDLYLATDPSVSGATNRTLAPRGVATILCVAADKYVITGAGLS